MCLNQLSSTSINPLGSSPRDIFLVYTRCVQKKKINPLSGGCHCQLMATRDFAFAGTQPRKLPVEPSFLNPWIFGDHFISQLSRLACEYLMSQDSVFINLLNENKIWLLACILRWFSVIRLMYLLRYLYMLVVYFKMLKSIKLVWK